MTNYRKNFYLLLLIAFLACLSLCYYAYNQNQEISQLVQQRSALTDTLTLYKTKDGKKGAYIPIFKGSKSDVLDVLKQTDPALHEVAKTTSGIKTVTKIKTIFKTDTVVKVDTLFIPNENEPSKKLYAAKTIENKYYTAKVILDGDSLSLGLQNTLDLNIVTKDKSNGFFKPKTYVIDVVHDNPYVDVIGLKSYEITPKSKTGFKVTIGVAVGVGAFLLLK